MDEQRIDKFLFCVRLFKTRTLAAEECGKSRILLNGVAVKGSRIVKVGDIISVKRNPIYRQYKVLNFIKSRVGAALVPNYIEEVTPQEDLFKLKMMNEISHCAFGVRDRGTGRPTKKERRDIDDFFNIEDDEDYDDED